MNLKITIANPPLRGNRKTKKYTIVNYLVHDFIRIVSKYKINYSELPDGDWDGDFSAIKLHASAYMIRRFNKAWNTMKGRFEPHLINTNRADHGKYSKSA